MISDFVFFYSFHVIILLLLVFPFSEFVLCLISVIHTFSQFYIYVNVRISNINFKCIFSFWIWLYVLRIFVVYAIELNINKNPWSTWSEEKLYSHSLFTLFHRRIWINSVILLQWLTHMLYFYIYKSYDTIPSILFLKNMLREITVLPNPINIFL